MKRKQGSAGLALGRAKSGAIPTVPAAPPTSTGAKPSSRTKGGRPPKGESLPDRSRRFLELLSSRLGNDDAIVAEYGAIHEDLLSKEAREREATWREFIRSEAEHCLRQPELKGQWPSDDIEGKVWGVKPRSATIVARIFDCTNDTIDNWRANERYSGALLAAVTARLQENKQALLDALKDRLDAQDDQYKSELKAARQRTIDTEPMDYVRQRVAKVKAKYLKPIPEK